MYERLFQLQEETLKTLANQKRLEIVQLLQNKELTVTEIVDMLGMPQANISQHLSLLRQVRIVTTRKDGLRVYYRLTDERIIAVVRELRAFLKSQFAHEPEIAHLNSLDSSIYPIVRDPVCGMRISVSEAYAHVEHDGQAYYFCAGGCKEHFEKHNNNQGMMRMMGMNTSRMKDDSSGHMGMSMKWQQDWGYDTNSSDDSDSTHNIH